MWSAIYHVAAPGRTTRAISATTSSRQRDVVEAEARHRAVEARVRGVKSGGVAHL